MMIDSHLAALPIQHSDTKPEKKDAVKRLKPVEDSGDSYESQLDSQKQDLSKKSSMKHITEDKSSIVYNSKGGIRIAGGDRYDTREEQVQIDISV